MEKCKKTIKRGPEPIYMEADCRKTVEKDDVDMACICRLITPKDEEKIDLEKIIFIAHICHKRVPKGEKCGSKYLTRDIYLSSSSRNLCFQGFTVPLTEFDGGVAAARAHLKSS